jgi:hypothetical protein
MMKSGEGVYALDFYVTGILNRSLSLLYGYETLLLSSNFVAAAHLVRPYLDSYLRLSSAWLVDDPHDFAKEVWKGVAVRKIRDKDGKLMSDAYLKSKAVVDFPWMGDVYDETSGFIHFSNKHVGNATRPGKKELTFTTYIGKTDNEVSDVSRIEAVACMIEISNAIARLIYGWIETKRIKG